MTRKFTFAIVLATVATLGSFASSQELVRSESPFRTAEYSESDAQVVQVRNRGRSYRGYYYGNRGYYPYRYRNYNYGYRSYPNYYYSNRNYGYYNYGRGGVRVGPVDVWW